MESHKIHVSNHQPENQSSIGEWINPTRTSPSVCHHRSHPEFRSWSNWSCSCVHTFCNCLGMGTRIDTGSHFTIDFKSHPGLVVTNPNWGLFCAMFTYHHISSHIITYLHSWNHLESTCWLTFQFIKPSKLSQAHSSSRYIWGLMSGSPVSSNSCFARNLLPDQSQKRHSLGESMGYKGLLSPLYTFAYIHGIYACICRHDHQCV